MQARASIFTSRTALPVPGRRAGATVPGGESAPWLITLADVVLVLLCLFTVLATKSEGRGANKDGGAVNGPERPEPAGAGTDVATSYEAANGSEAVEGDETAATAESAATAAGGKSTAQIAGADMERGLREIFRPAGGLAEIARAPGEITVRLRDSISFLSGSAELLPSVLPFLDGIADLLTAHPGVRIETSGHTDDLPISTSIYPSNWELSTARAAAVARYLLARAPLDPAHIRVAGYAEHRPIDPGRTPEGRARNRRVEIRFLARAPSSRSLSSKGSLE